MDHPELWDAIALLFHGEAVRLIFNLVVLMHPVDIPFAFAHGTSFLINGSVFPPSCPAFFLSLFTVLNLTLSNGCRY
jgi:hypothetical protein